MELLPLFLRQFATMVDAGLPLSRCLTVLSNQSTGRLKRVASLMHTRIESGWNLTEAVKEHPRVFTRLQVNMFHAGESSGHLDKVLLKMAETLEYLTKLKKEFISKMIYPVCLLHAGVILPALPIWFSAGTEAALDQILSVFIPLYLSGILLVLLYKAGSTLPGVRYIFDLFLYYCPVLGGALRKIAVASFARTFEALNSAGLSVLQSVPMAAEATGNLIMERRIKKAEPMLKDGENLEVAILATGAFDSMVNNMIATGAESGKLDAMLSKISEYAEEDAKVSIDRMGKVIPGVVYGIIAFYIASQIFKMAGEYMKTMNSLF